METQFFKRQQGTLAYSDYGGGGALALMLPGMGALRSEYRFLAPRLRDAGFHPVSMDLRGQGESSVPWEHYDTPSVGEDILAMIAHLDAGPAHVLATSFAAAPAVWAAVEQPSQVRSLTLIGAVVRESKLSPLMAAAMWLMFNNPWRARTWVAYYNMLYPSHKPADFGEYKRQLRQNLSEPGRFHAAIALGGSPRKPALDRLAEVKAPTLVLMGTKDPDFPDPPAEGRFIAGQTGGKLELIEGAGHYPQTEMHEQVAPLIVDFLKQPDQQAQVGSEKVKAA